MAYYPWISLGGYALSEIPFTFCVAGTAFYGLRLADEGRPRDAWWLGRFPRPGRPWSAYRRSWRSGACRSGLHLLLRRRAWRRFTRGLVPRAAAPLALVLALSALRLHAHTGGWGLVSTNGPLNIVFGRCHNVVLEAIGPDWRGFFGPPALGSFLRRQKIAEAYHRSPPLFTLDPAFGEKLQIQGHMWDAEPNEKLACELRGPEDGRPAPGQVRGHARGAALGLQHHLARHGEPEVEPADGGGVPRPQHRLRLGARGGAAALAFQRRRARSMLLALHVFSVVVMSMLYFGDTRYRAPYDGIIIILAMQLYVEALVLLRAGQERLLGASVGPGRRRFAGADRARGSRAGTSARAASATDPREPRIPEPE